MTPVGPAVTINVTLCPKSRANKAELCLFEVTGDPDILQMNNRQQLLPRLNVYSGQNCILHLSRHRSCDFRVAKIEFGLFEICATELDSGPCGKFARAHECDLFRSSLRRSMERP